MIISYCIPVHNRTYDLRETLPGIIKAANNSPPVEIVILDYNSRDDLADYLYREIAGVQSFIGAIPTSWNLGTALTYRKYEGRDHYHMAHARNLAMLASSGEFIISSNADLLVDENYFKVVRDALEAEDLTWIRHHRRQIGIVGVKRDEFIDAGGFDERFEYYGKEDRDIDARLERRGGAFVVLPEFLLKFIPTPKKEKFKNYRGNLSGYQMGKYSKKIWQENIDNEVLVANKGVEWGKWD